VAETNPIPAVKPIDDKVGKFCCQCGKEFYPKDLAQKFCTAQCKNQNKRKEYQCRQDKDHYIKCLLRKPTVIKFLEEL
jgi:hypothetical protein